MKVSELITHLQRLPQSSEVRMATDDTSDTDFGILDILNDTKHATVWLDSQPPTKAVPIKYANLLDYERDIVAGD